VKVASPFVSEDGHAAGGNCPRFVTRSIVAVVIDVGGGDVNRAVRSIDRIGIQKIGWRAERAVAIAEEDGRAVAGGHGQVEMIDRHSGRRRPGAFGECESVEITTGAPEVDRCRRRDRGERRFGDVFASMASRSTLPSSFTSAATSRVMKPLVAGLLAGVSAVKVAGGVVVVEQDRDGVAYRIHAESGLISNRQIGSAVVVEVGPKRWPPA